MSRRCDVIERMNTTRRSLLMAAAALAGSWNARSQESGDVVIAQQVVDRIKAKVGIPWLAETVDGIIIGSPGIHVRGIATTMMATLDVLQRAAASGKNMVITHEPTFYSHQDSTEPLAKDPTFQAKREFIAEHEIVVFRLHDHWHRMTPDGIDSGMRYELGWGTHAVADGDREFVFPTSQLREFAATMAARLGSRSMRIVGDPKTPIRRVIARWGYASLMPDLINAAARTDVDLIIVGETREWELVEYVQDQIAAGNNKALIVLNHVVSEQAGMKYCAKWLKEFIPEVPVEFVPSQEPFWQLKPSRA
jgi:putative NIF3 family GTP cyclohydrolase 1 type 2